MFEDHAFDSTTYLENQTSAVDQKEIEKQIAEKANQVITETENALDEKRLAKTRSHIQPLKESIKRVQDQLANTLYPSGRKKLQDDIQDFKKALEVHEQDEMDIITRLEIRSKNAADSGTRDDNSGRLPEESKRDFLIRTGKITPFSKISLDPNGEASLEEMLNGTAQEYEPQTGMGDDAAMSHQNLPLPGFLRDKPAQKRRRTSATDDKAKKRARQSIVAHTDSLENPKFQKDAAEVLATQLFSSSQTSSDLSEPPSRISTPSSDRDYRFSDNGSRAASTSESSVLSGSVSSKAEIKDLDDGNEEHYQRRLKNWSISRAEARGRVEAAGSDDPGAHNSIQATEHRPEWQLPHPNSPDFSMGKFKVPGDIFPALYAYQKTGVQWLWELYQQGNGGIIGDEMGLGKTIQAIAFIAGLHYSGQLDKPVIVVAPATVMKQWVKEFHKWWPPLRVSILHASGSGMHKLPRADSLEEVDEDDYAFEESQTTESKQRARRIIQRVQKMGHVLVTTYNGLKSYSDFLNPIDWGYAVLDEGHKIRNPDADVTIYCKELKTNNRLILSGTPMQNNLTELWSLFDFVFPMRLETLVDFKRDFEIPIKLGGFANASNLQVQTATECAQRLRDAIKPYLLQRFKADVAADLPPKVEKVLMCQLPPAQRKLYEMLLASAEMQDIQENQPLKGIDLLRKLCNHPDLIERAEKKERYGDDYGSKKRSGKLLVVEGLLQQWKADGRKTLLFCQTKQMLDILEKLVNSLPNFTYSRMDGETSIGSRQRLVDEFNNTPELDVFLLTTKVGGLGINLTGASRVIIYDPDWNPSTDSQAKERAWRLGQKKDVVIFRLLMAGTVEDKIYKRQIYKEFLTKKIMRDPSATKKFEMTELADLFALEPEAKRGEIAGTAKGFENAVEHFDKPADGAEVAGVVDTKAVPWADNDLVPKDQSAMMLSSIFSKAGVHSAMDHEVVLNGSSAAARQAITANEARRVADRAEAALDRAAVVARAVPAGVPTWTGTVGTAGRSTGRNPRSQGLGSASVMANLQARQASQRMGRSGNRSVDLDRLAPDFRDRLTKYFLNYNGKVVVRMLLDQYAREVDTGKKKDEFLRLLREIAEEVPGGREGRQQWILKSVKAKAREASRSKSRRASPARNNAVRTGRVHMISPLART